MHVYTLSGRLFDNKRALLFIIMLNTNQFSPWRLSTAPMLDWTNRHYRFMARQLTKHTRLYTEMIHANALIYGKSDDFLLHNECEYPLALQLGGSNPYTLAQATLIASKAGFTEINLNCGCPSPKVQKGAFGACLMKDVKLVAECINAMSDVTDSDITIKHRIGLDNDEDYNVLQDFVTYISEKTSCNTFIIHARNAILAGLSPKENREIPPLKYDFVYKIKQDFPNLTIVVNGGISNNNEIAEHLNYVDGVMLGRAIYHQPLIMRNWDNVFFNDNNPMINDETIIDRLYNYAINEIKKGVPLRCMVTHWLGLFHGYAGAKRWRQILSDSNQLSFNKPELIYHAFNALHT